MVMLVIVVVGGSCLVTVLVVLDGTFAIVIGDIVLLS